MVVRAGALDPVRSSQHGTRRDRQGHRPGRLAALMVRCPPRARRSWRHADHDGETKRVVGVQLAQVVAALSQCHDVAALAERAAREKWRWCGSGCGLVGVTQPACLVGGLRHLGADEYGSVDDLREAVGFRVGAIRDGDLVALIDRSVEDGLVEVEDWEPGTLHPTRLTRRGNQKVQEFDRAPLSD